MRLMQVTVPSDRMSKYDTEIPFQKEKEAIETRQKSVSTDTQSNSQTESTD